jgi:primosomal protein N' (replication factor Y) (superfamily II helicase)
MGFVEVAVGLPVRGTYHYALPPQLGEARVGARVLVPFGARGVTGVVVARTDRPPAGVDVRLVRDILDDDDDPALDAQLVELCLWMADYYEAPPGEVLRTALPAGTAEGWSARPELTASGRAALAGEGSALAGGVRRALAMLAAGKRLPRAELARLVASGLAQVVDRRKRPRVRERRVNQVRLVPTPAGPDAPADASPPPRGRRRAELVAHLQAAGDWVDVLALPKPLRAAVRPLVAAGIVERGDRAATRDPWQPVAVYAPAEPLPPTPEQARALAELCAAVAAPGFRPFLLHGVTGSGKTEVYLQAIAAALAAGRGALVLVPEIALTPQLAARFRARFGDRVAILHSGLTDADRFDQWRRLRAGGAAIALGARSAVFAPVRNLGILVVDEEHDPSFKQEEGVRYHARDVALVRAQRAGAVCVLGSATPSLESYALARGGRYRLLELGARAHARPLPGVEVVDLRTYRADGESLLSAPLTQALDETLAAGDQAILFLNRRGFATFIVCCACGHAFRCPQCSIALTYHRAGERLRCHYCGHAEHVPTECPRCHAQAIRRLGLGTERIEAALAARYPRARVARLDRDTAAGSGLRQVLERVARREIDVLVGTQMVTKGHDFPGVTLVGVLLADTALSLPDFRAAERTFQLLTQVAGRAGRGERSGRVIIQTYVPEHVAVTCARGHDYQAFFAVESATRAELGYPPHGRLVAVRFDGGDEKEVRALADELADRARRLCAGAAAVSVLGPAEAPLRRLKGRARWQLWAKSSDRALLRSFVRRLVADLPPRGDVKVTVDVDPMSAL